MSEKKSKSKNNGFNNFIYIAGTVALVFMLAFSAVNFIKDARILKLPVLSNAAPVVKNPKSTEDGGYKTLKYQKPEAAATPKPRKTRPKKTAEPKPSPAPEPTKAPEP